MENDKLIIDMLQKITTSMDEMKVELKADIQEVKQEVAQVKQEVTSVKQEIVEVKKRLDNVEGKLDGIGQQFEESTKHRIEVERRHEDDIYYKKCKKWTRPSSYKQKRTKQIQSCKTYLIHL
ncbi:hypothetical protein [Lysinibacillus sp. 54212]|uniref:hypothetical protein n=1 Tax=Lysinibacillus sp. 54212 TaxID=3119829 RepID=UPI002FC88414